MSQVGLGFCSNSMLPKRPSAVFRDTYFLAVASMLPVKLSAPCNLALLPNLRQRILNPGPTSPFGTVLDDWNTAKYVFKSLHVTNFCDQDADEQIHGVANITLLNLFIHPPFCWMVLDMIARAPAV
jgi:hypothetical protein